MRCDRTRERTGAAGSPEPDQITLKCCTAASAEVAALESLRTTEPQIIMFTAAHADLKTRADNEPAIDGFVLKTESTQLSSAIGAQLPDAHSPVYPGSIPPC